MVKAVVNSKNNRTITAILPTDTSVLECSSRGDRRFSSFYAMVKIHGVEKSIEHYYRWSLRTDRDRQARGKTPVHHVVCPFTGNILPPSDAKDLYMGLWVTYFKQKPELIAYAKQFETYSDQFMRETDVTTSPAIILSAYIADEEHFVKILHKSHWYQELQKAKERLRQNAMSEGSGYLQSKNTSAAATIAADNRPHTEYPRNQRTQRTELPKEIRSGSSLFPDLAVKQKEFTDTENKGKLADDALGESDEPLRRVSARPMDIEQVVSIPREELRDPYCEIYNRLLLQEVVFNLDNGDVKPSDLTDDIKELFRAIKDADPNFWN